MEYTRRLLVEMTGLNKVIMYLTLSDVFTWGMYVIVSAFTGLYLQTKLQMDVVEIVGIGAACFYIARVLFQIPIGMVTDSLKKDTDEIIFLMLGNLLMGIPLLLYPFIQTAVFFYFLQFVIGIGASMNLVNWRKLFAANLDTGRSGRAYAVYDTITSLSIAILGILGGQLAGLGEESFNNVIYFAGVIMILSSLWPGLIFLGDRKSRRSL
jgi:MFS family permease